MGTRGAMAQEVLVRTTPGVRAHRYGSTTHHWKETGLGFLSRRRPTPAQPPSASSWPAADLRHDGPPQQVLQIHTSQEDGVHE